LNAQEDPFSALSLRSVRTIQMSAAIKTDDDEDAADPGKEAEVPTSVTVFTGPGELGLAWRIRMKRDDMRVTASMIAIYGGANSLDLGEGSSRPALEAFVEGRGQTDVKPAIAALAAAAEGILARPSVKAIASLIRIEDVIQVGADVDDEQSGELEA